MRDNIDGVGTEVEQQTLTEMTGGGGCERHEDNEDLVKDWTKEYVDRMLEEAYRIVTRRETAAVKSVTWRLGYMKLVDRQLVELCDEIVNETVDKAHATIVRRETATLKTTKWRLKHLGLVDRQAMEMCKDIVGETVDRVDMMITRRAEDRIRTLSRRTRNETNIKPPKRKAET